MRSAFGVTHEIAKTYLGAGKWKPVLALSSFERKVARKASWHKPEPSDAPLSGRKIPKKAYIKNVGQVRVQGPQGKKHFLVLDNRDQRRIVHRRNLGFRK